MRLHSRGNLRSGGIVVDICSRLLICLSNLAGNCFFPDGDWCLILLYYLSGIIVLHCIFSITTDIFGGFCGFCHLGVDHPHCTWNYFTLYLPWRNSMALVLHSSYWFGSRNHGWTLFYDCRGFMLCNTSCGSWSDFSVYFRSYSQLFLRLYYDVLYSSWFYHIKFFRAWGLLIFFSLNHVRRFVRLKWRLFLFHGWTDKFSRRLLLLSCNFCVFSNIYFLFFLPFRNWRQI